jgi:hypothetical protein
MTTPAPLDLLELPIRVWMPMDPSDVCLAKIGNTPMLFTGKTPMSARKAADDWRREERAKAIARDAGVARRVEAMKAAREAKKQAQAGAEA